MECWQVVVLDPAELEGISERVFSWNIANVSVGHVLVPGCPEICFKYHSADTMLEMCWIFMLDIPAE